MIVVRPQTVMLMIEKSDSDRSYLFLLSDVQSQCRENGEVPKVVVCSEEILK